MSILTFTGFETGDSIEANSTSGTISYSTSVTRSGSYSLRSNPTTTAIGRYVVATLLANGANTALSSGITTVYFGIYFRYATKPAANDEMIFMVGDSLATIGFEIRLNSSGNLVSYDSTPTLVQTGATVLAANTWYYLSGSVTAGAGTGSCTIKLNNVTELSSSSQQFGITIKNLAIGKVLDRNSQTVDFYFDDVIIDDTTEPNSEMAIVVLHPAANGSTMQWTSGTGASDYTQVDETVPATADYVMTTSTAGDLALFTIQTLASQFSDGFTYPAIRAVCGASEDTSVTSENAIRVKSGATNSTSNKQNLSTTMSERIRLLLVDPNTSVAWTEAGINALEFGLIESNAAAVRMQYGGVMVLVDQSAPTDIKKVSSVAQASIKKISSVTEAGIKKVTGVNNV